jgi:tungstate transport system substrate-binding protein
MTICTRPLPLENLGRIIEAETNAAREVHIFGSPAFSVGKELFWEMIGLMMLSAGAGMLHRGWARKSRGGQELSTAFIALCLLALGAIFALCLHAAAVAQERAIIVASTTSTEQSGLFGFLLPRFTAKTGITVKVVAVGTGQALDIGRRGDVDVVFVHDQPAEEKFMAEGFGVRRYDVMYNDFVVVGPMADPAHVAGGKDVIAAFRSIAAARAPFVSRGDRSGTHEAELRYWKEAGIAVGAARDSWYREIGQGMGPALNMAASLDAYLLADRSTWLSFRNRGTLAVLVEGDSRLFNQYGIMLVNPAKHPNVKVADGQAFVDWLISADGQTTIAQYRIGGQQLFFPDAEASRQEP